MCSIENLSVRTVYACVRTYVRAHIPHIVSSFNITISVFQIVMGDTSSCRIDMIPILWATGIANINIIVIRYQMMGEIAKQNVSSGCTHTCTSI